MSMLLRRYHEQSEPEQEVQVKAEPEKKEETPKAPKKNGKDSGKK